MMIKTHIALAVLAVLLFVPHVSNKILFIAVVLIATFIPDIDSGFSTLGKRGIFRILQVFTKHRGFIHSFTFCIFVSLILAFFFPLVAFGFFLGYALHLIADSFTQEGITPFWPYSKITSGIIKTGGRIEASTFLALMAIDLIVFILTVQKIL